MLTYDEAHSKPAHKAFQLLRERRVLAVYIEAPSQGFKAQGTSHLRSHRSPWGVKSLDGDDKKWVQSTNVAPNLAVALLKLATVQKVPTAVVGPKKSSFFALPAIRQWVKRSSHRQANMHDFGAPWD